MSLWIDNDQGTYNYWRERAAELHGDPPADEYGVLTTEQRARFALAGELKDAHEQESADLLETSARTASVFSDLLGSALGRVDWNFIAENMLEDIED